MGLEKDEKDATETLETAANPDAPAPAPVPPPAPTPAEPAKPVQYVGRAIPGVAFDPKDIQTLQPGEFDFGSIRAAAAGSTPPPPELANLHPLRVPTTDMLIKPIKARASNAPPLPPARSSYSSITAVKQAEAIPQKPQPVLFHMACTPGPTIVMDIKQNVELATQKIVILFDETASERTRTASTRDNIKFDMVGTLMFSGELALEAFVIKEKKPDYTERTMTEVFEEIKKDLKVFEYM